MLKKKCHEILDQISEERLYDALLLLTEMRDRKANDFVTYIDGIPVYNMSNKEHSKRLVLETHSYDSKLKYKN